MTDDLETLSRPLVEHSALNNGSGLLDAIHQQWLERTAGGDIQLISSRLAQQIESGEPDEESYFMLLDGYIAKIGKEHVSDALGEADIYLAGKRAVRSYFESANSTKAKKLDCGIF